MRKAREGLLPSPWWIVDVLASAWVFSLVAAQPAFRSAAARPADVDALLVPALAASLAGPILLEAWRMHGSEPRDGAARGLERLLLAAVVSTLVVALARALCAAPLGPAFAPALGAGQLAAWSGLRGLRFGLQYTSRRFTRASRNALVVGSGSRALHVLRQLQRHPEWGLRVVGFLDDRGTPHDPRIRVGNVYQLADLPNILRSQVIDEVIAACPRSMLERIGPVVATCAAAGIPLTVLSDLYGDYLPPPQITRFGSLAALSFATLDHSRAQLAVKRAVDILGASLALLLFAPVALLAAALSEGSRLGHALRCGRHGRPFRMWSLGVTPRLARWNLDALPRLWNVLRGDMSLVGPRPPTPHEVSQCESYERRRLAMRPGLIGLARLGDPDASPRDRVKLDLEYVDSWSLGLDARILLRSAAAALQSVYASVRGDQLPARIVRDQPVATPPDRVGRPGDVHSPRHRVL